MPIYADSAPQVGPFLMMMMLGASEQPAAYILSQVPWAQQSTDRAYVKGLQ